MDYDDYTKLKYPDGVPDDDMRNRYDNTTKYAMMSPMIALQCSI